MTIRPLPVLAVSLLIGGVAGTGISYLPITIFSFSLLVLLGMVLLARTGRLVPGFACLVYGVFLLGAVSASLAQIRAESPSLSRTAGPGRVDLVGTIDAPVRYGPDRAFAVVSVQRLLSPAHASPAEGRLRLAIRGSVPPLAIGDVIQFETRVRPPRGFQNPGGFDYGAYLRRSGIQAVGSVTLREDGSGLRVLARAGHPVMARVDRWRGHIRAAALRTLDPEAAGIYLSLVTGESGFLRQDIRDAFLASGTTHILSISGSHLGLIGVVVFWVVRRSILALPAPWLLRLSRRVTATRLAAAVTVFPVTFYALLGGAEVATVRSLLMLLLFLGAILLGRAHSVGTGLAAAAILIVLWDPLAPYDISFQLSFLSVLAIVLFVLAREDSKEELDPPPRQQGGVLGWMRTGAVEVLLISLVVTVATAPLVAVHFNQVAWVGTLSNLLVVPFVGFLVVPLGLLACLATLLTGSDDLVGGPLLKAVIEALVWIVKAWAAVPGAELRVASPPIWQVLAFYLLLGVAWVRWRRWAGRLGAALALGLLLLWAWSPHDLPEAGTVRVTFLDVGQGDAALVETAEGPAMLIDGGGASDSFDLGRAVVAPLLWDRGIRRLDVVVASHPQQDHIGGLAFVVRQFEVGEFWGNGVERDKAFAIRVKEALEGRHVTVRAVSNSDEERALGNCRLRVLHPGRSEEVAVEEVDGKHLNNRSVVLRLACGETAFLFTGDVEKEAEADMIGAAGLVEATVLKVPHHGARGSVYEPFVRAVKPRVAVVSVGANNSYGHPTPAMLETYAQLGIPVLRTDRDGAVTVLAAASGLAVTCEADHRLTPVNFPAKGSDDGELHNLRRLVSRYAPCRRLS
jgi:competence protein ComEC